MENTTTTLKNALMTAIENAVFAGMEPAKINEVIASLMPDSTISCRVCGSTNMMGRRMFDKGVCSPCYNKQHK